MVTRIIDFVFYKLFEGYKKKELSPIYTSVLYVIFISLFILLFIGVSLDLLLNIRLPFKSKWQTLIVVGLIELPFMIWMYYRYTRKGKIKELEEKYSNEKYNKIRFWHIFMLPVFFLILIFIVVFTFGNAVFLPGRK